ncbi:MULTISPECIES: flavin monoamine oxidase family protein [Caballeronia]|uniref:flavin monoamine oxidase family protein n=1 Tax=Caballeronia TaxID=1827195 RepID=UPI001FD13B34|nr:MULTISPECIES: flavin monoamine oxidase family protein [Caballeronia]MDR5799145.1 flavin monoamine oxidase family protein [Caballeronia sp. LZ001]
MQKLDCDIVIVGAGMSGLSAARAATRAGKSVIVLEARDRVGGRTLSKTLDNGVTIDLGGQWVAPTQKRVLALIEEFGLKIFKTYQTGDSIAYLNGEKVRYEGVIPKRDPETDADIENGMALLEELAASIPLEAPWTHPRALELDRQTFADWINANLKTEFGRWVYDRLAPGVFSVEACELSLLHVAFYFGAAGGVDRLTSTDGGGQDSRFQTGAQQLSINLAKELGERIRLEQIVTKIEQDSVGVTVTTEDRKYVARRVIVALPPTLTGRIRYVPALPASRDSLTQRMPMGTALKTMVRYRTPFWRADGLSGLVFTDHDTPQLVYDNSPDDGSCGILLLFTEGIAARKWSEKTAEEREAAAIEVLVKCFGAKATEYEEFIEKYWVDEEFSRGCYAGTMPAGAWTSFGPVLSRPVGHIHWAGTETATCWNGYIEGAIQAGERASLEAITSIDDA